MKKNYYIMFLQNIVRAITALSIACIVTGCSGNKTAGGPGSDIPVFAVNTSTAVQGQVWDYIALSGDIYAGSSVDVFSNVAGKVTQVYVQLGSRVNRGSSIAAVDPSLPGMNFIPAVTTAPISGTIIALPAQIGATVSQAIPLARISGTGALEIKLHVAERFISKIAMNQLCEITLDAWPGEVFRGTVTEISPVVNPASRTMEVKVNVTNQEDKLKEGMFSKVKLITEQKENTVKIPASALIQRFGENYVYVVEETTVDEQVAEQTEKKKGFLASIFGKKETEEAEEKGATQQIKVFIAKKRIVTPGIQIDGVLEITGGLKPGEEFIVKGQTLINEDARINIIERVTPLSAGR